jgi:hypothetical protein
MSQSVGNTSHAVIAYKIDYAGGEIYLADPNFPDNKTRKIIVQNGNLQGYFSGDNANNAGSIEYTKFQFFGQSAVYNWYNITFRWGSSKTMQSETISFRH